MKHINDKHPNFRDENGKFYLVRCFNCDKEYGMENYAPAVATGCCVWCGWRDPEREICQEPFL